MQTLILGGTRFLGYAVATAARERGHHVTCLARGSGPVPDGTDLVVSDRDADDGLAPVAGRTWDSVIDLATEPGHVRKAVRDLRTPHRVQVSTASVYARGDQPEQAEDSPVMDPLTADVMDGMQDYGPAKVACEHLVRSAEGTSTVVRAGLIAGPGDVSGRTGYYPWRFAHPTGPDVLVPDDLEMPMALIDVDDLAAWIVLAAEHRIPGTFNATGPTTTLGALLEQSRLVARSAATVRVVPLDVLEREGVGQWAGPRSLPLWIAEPAMRWFATLDTSAARAAGLSTRPLAQTLARALQDEESRTVPRACGLTDEEEILLRAALVGQ